MFETTGKCEKKVQMLFAKTKRHNDWGNCEKNKAKKKKSEQRNSESALVCSLFFYMRMIKQQFSK